jgi:hypothetical protein
MNSNEEKIASLNFMNRLKNVCQKIDDEDIKFGKNRICYILTNIYNNVDDEDIKIELRKAVYAAKMMGTKLRLIKKQKKEKQKREKTI